MNAFEIIVKAISYHPYRYLNVKSVNDPSYIDACEHKWRCEHSLQDEFKFIALNHNDWLFVKTYLKPIKPLTFWHKKIKTMIHQIEMILLVLSLIGIIISILVNDINYQRFFYEILPCVRLLLLIKGNSDSIFTIYSVIPDLFGIFGLAVCFIIIYAIIGVRFFAHQTDVLYCFFFVFFYFFYFLTFFDFFFFECV